MGRASARLEQATRAVKFAHPFHLGDVVVRWVVMRAPQVLLTRHSREMSPTRNRGIDVKYVPVFIPILLVLSFVALTFYRSISPRKAQSRPSSRPAAAGRCFTVEVQQRVKVREGLGGFLVAEASSGGGVIVRQHAVELAHERNLFSGQCRLDQLRQDALAAPQRDSGTVLVSVCSP